MSCFHCDDTNACICIVCGIDTLAGRVLGPCLACKGRLFHVKHMAILEKYDPADPKNWRTVAAADGNKGYRVYIPFEGLK